MIEREHRAIFTEQLRQRRGRGRPRSASPKVITAVRLPEDVYDALSRLSLAERRSIHALMQAAIESYTLSHRPA